MTRPNPQPLLLILVALSASCVSCSQDSGTPQQQTTAPTVVAYPPGEYIAKQSVVAAIDADTLTLAIKAFNRKDMESLSVLKNDGRVFVLPKGTRIALEPAEVSDAQLSTALQTTTNGVDVCGATVESGEYIGKRRGSMREFGQTQT